MTVRVFPSQQRRFVVLDWDGAILEEREYLSEAEQVGLLPGVGAALRQDIKMLSRSLAERLIVHGKIRPRISPDNKLRF